MEFKGCRDLAVLIAFSRLLLTLLTRLARTRLSAAAAALLLPATLAGLLLLLARFRVLLVRVGLVGIGHTELLLEGFWSGRAPQPESTQGTQPSFREMQKER
jgi:hypothetical protein